MQHVLVAIVSFIIALGILVLVHEFGHFLAAKLCGVRVEQFSIGFPPRLFGFKVGDTDYCISATPLGGYVKMTGESMPGENLSLDGADHDSIAAQRHDPGALTSHPRWQRILIGLAGPLANFIFAVVIMTGFYMLHNEVPVYESQAPKIDWVIPGSAADAAGIQPGDTIVNFDGQENPTWEVVGLRIGLNLQSENISHNVWLAVLRSVNGTAQRVVLSMPLAGVLDAKSSPEAAFDKIGLLIAMQPGPVTVSVVTPGTPAAAAGIEPGDQFLTVDGHAFHGVPTIISYLQSRKGAPLNVQLSRGGKISNLTVQPRQEPAPDGSNVWRIGFGGVQPPSRVEQMPLVPAFGASIKFNRDNSLLILEILKRLFTHKMAVTTLSGPVGIAQQTGMAAETPGWEAKFRVLAAISVNLGMLNLLPFPILDGGMILFLLIESLIRRDVNIVIKERVYQAAFIIIIVFFVYIMFNDISKLPIFSHTKL
jgi:regulator of sigma E protease